MVFADNEFAKANREFLNLPNVVVKFRNMGSTLLTSFIGIIVFSVLMTVGYIYANGKWNVAENKRKNYMIWVNKHGKTLKWSIGILSIIYGLSMLFQIISLFEKLPLV